MNYIQIKKNNQLIVWFMVLLYILFVGNKSIQAQSNTIFNQLSVHNGLSQSTVYSMLQDADGFIWIATRDGLNKYDGYNFTIYRNIKNDSMSISDNRIFALVEDRMGFIYIGTDEGLNIYDKNYDTFKSFKNNIADSNSLNNNHIYALLVDSKQNIWIGTDGGGVSIYNREKKQFRKLNIPIAFETEDRDIKVRTMLELRNGDIWIGTKGHGVFIYNYQNGTVIQKVRERDNNIGLLSNSIRYLYEDSEKNIWIGTDEDGLTQYNVSTNSYKYYLAQNKNSISHNAVRTIFEDENKNIWVATRVGLNKINASTKAIVHYFHDELNDKTISNNSIRSILQDKSGNLWFGTYYGGISIIYGSSQNFRNYIPNSYNKNSLSYEVVSSFAEDSKNNIWIGTEGGGINKLDVKNNNFFVIQQSSKLAGLSNDNVKALFMDDNNVLWIGTYGGGLDIYNIISKKFTNYKFVANDSTSLSSNNIYDIYKDSKGRYWIGTNLGGLNIFDSKQHNFQRINPINAQGEYIFGSTINDIQEDAYGNVWFATDAGLVKFDGMEYHSVDFQYDGAEKHSEENILSIHIDSFGAIWIGTEGNGLYGGPDTKQIENTFSKKEVLAGKVIYGMVEDNYKNLWVSSNVGITKIPLSKQNAVDAENDAIVVHYDLNDGLQGNEFNRGAAFKTKDGTIYFGGLKGFNSFDASQITQNTTKPPVVITGFYVSNKKIETYTGDSPLKKHISETQLITLKHNQSSFSFEFVALNYDKPQKNKYTYRLEGFNTEWVNAGKNHLAVYTNIDPGEYKFKVRASNNDNLWNTDGAEIDLIILPPFWKTKWAFLIYFVFVTLMLLLFRRFIVYSTNQKNLLDNERIEKQRIEELNQMKLRFFTNISHEFRTPLTLISGPLEKLMKKKTQTAEEQMYLYALMHKNVSRLQRLINQLMEFRKLENKKMKLKVSSNNLNDFIDDVVQGFSEFCRQKNIELIFDSHLSHRLEFWFDGTVVDNIIFILLSNATKFTGSGGQIKVDLNQMHSNIQIKISDTGIGIPKDKLNRIFERFYTDDSIKYTKNMGTGIGLSFAQSLVELHRGTIMVESEEGKGTTFIVSIPVEESAFTGEELIPNAEPTIPQHQIATPDIVPEAMPIYDEEKDENGDSILIVEDNRELREFIKSHFTSYTIYEAENGKEAFKMAKKYIPSLIISDVMMPIMDGMEFCSHIKSNLITNHIPLILLTAKTSVEHKIEGASLGADLYLEKPFNIELLEANVNNLLVQRKNLRERFAGQITSDNPEQFLNKVEDDFINKVKEIIYSRKSDPELTVEDLGSELGLSRSQLFRKFKALTDHSPNEFIKVVRLKYATELMVLGELNINQITFECGFSSASHFIASFKKYYNKTPKEYASLMASKKQPE